MKLIISQATANLVPFCGELLDNHRDYAKAQGWEYQCHAERCFEQHSPAHDKIGFMQQALASGADPVLWVDADVAFMDHTWNIGGLLDYGQIDVATWPEHSAAPVVAKSPGAWLAGYNQKNWPALYLCTGIMLVRNNWLSRAFFAEVSRSILTVPNVRLDTAEEQSRCNHLLMQTSFFGVHMCSAREIGGFSPDLWHDDDPYQPGDPTIHFAGTAHGQWAERQRLFAEKYMPQVKR